MIVLFDSRFCECRVHMFKSCHLCLVVLKDVRLIRKAACHGPNVLCRPLDLMPLIKYSLHFQVKVVEAKLCSMSGIEPGSLNLLYRPRQPHIITTIHGLRGQTTQPGPSWSPLILLSCVGFFRCEVCSQLTSLLFLWSQFESRLGLQIWQVFVKVST